MRAVLPDDTGDPAEQAARWLSYLYSGVTSEDGMQAFSTWLHRCSANGDAYAELQQLWRDLALVEGSRTAASQSLPPCDDHTDADGAGDPPQPFDHAKPRSAMRMAVAAVLLIGLVGGGIWRLYGPDRVAVADYRTGIAETRRVSLSDGSVITLSASSSLHTEISGTKRSVVLDAGRAFFDIAPDRWRPFTVNAGRTRLRVVGTEFDVNRSSGDVRISVTSGVVDVGPGAGGATWGIRLVAGQRATTSGSGEPGAIEGFDPRGAMPWLRGMLVYRDEPLGDVVAEVNRYRAVKIFLADDALARMPVTMAVRTDQTDSLVIGLEEMRLATVERTAGGLVIHSAERKRSR